jgi:tetratricopeptide (TPR) repeat protein
MKPEKPSFLLSYWRPWKGSGANLIDSYLDYTRDTALVKYGADTVGKYIKQASKEQVQAIDQLGQKIGRGLKDQAKAIDRLGRSIEQGMHALYDQMELVNANLTFLNRNLDVQIEQQRVANVLLENISELLRVPDSEKARHHSIELGLKFFINAAKDPDLYTDALEELIKAESLMKQDFFVLHRIGLIYLHVEKHLDIEKAIDYFSRAAKYASIESDPMSVRLADVLTRDVLSGDVSGRSTEAQIGKLAAESYEKAAFGSYVLGRDEEAVGYQSKALKFNPIPQNRFFLAKYQARAGNVPDAVANLNSCIDSDPVLMPAVFKEIDLINEPKILSLVENKINRVNENINELRDKIKNESHNISEKFIAEIDYLADEPYEIKVKNLERCEEKYEILKNEFNEFKLQIENLINDFQILSASVSVDRINQVINKIKDLQGSSLEEMKLAYKEALRHYDIFSNEIKSKNNLYFKLKDLAIECENGTYVGIDEQKKSEIINNLINSSGLSLREMSEVYNQTKAHLENQKLRIGSIYAGGIVIYLDETGRHGLVCAEEDFGEAVWGGHGILEMNADDDGVRRDDNDGSRFGRTLNHSGVADGRGMQNTKMIIERASNIDKKGLFRSGKESIITAASLCVNSRYNGYSDWYLPTGAELLTICQVLEALGKMSLLPLAKYWTCVQTVEGHTWFDKAWIVDVERHKHAGIKKPFSFPFDSYPEYDFSLVPCDKYVKCKVRGVRAF